MFLSSLEFTMTSWSSDIFYMTGFPEVTENAEAMGQLTHKPTTCLEKNQVFIGKNFPRNRELIML